MTDTDSELLELAARAVGYRYRGPAPTIGQIFQTQDGECRWVFWNPLTDDGDALRLAVRLRIDIDFEGENVVFADGNWSEPTDTDECSAVRRAIVRAAAEIGRSMK